MSFNISWTLMTGSTETERTTRENQLNAVHLSHINHQKDLLNRRTETSVCEENKST